MHPLLEGLALLVPAIGTMLVLVLGVGVVTAITRQSRLRRLARSRNPQAAFAEFCAAFANKTEDLLQSIYSSLQAMLQVDNFQCASMTICGARSSSTREIPKAESSPSSNAADKWVRPSRLARRCSCGSCITCTKDR